MPIIGSNYDAYNPEREEANRIRKLELMNMSVDDLVKNSSVGELNLLFPEATSYSDAERHNQTMVQIELSEDFPCVEKIAEALQRLKAIEELGRSK
jgi:hypothetical protein